MVLLLKETFNLKNMQYFDLAKSEIRQISISTKQDNINAKIEQKSIEKFLLENLNLIEKLYINVKDKLYDDFIGYLKKKKKLIFKINRHEQIYCSNINKDVEKIFKYLLYRFKFRTCGTKKIILENPPYILIEPVSTCNLRCPFCFQTDKSFTKKPYMGVMKFDLFKKIVDEADEIGVGGITLASRGEPTLHKNFADMLKYIHSKKNIYELKTNTNATFLNEKMCYAILENNVNSVVISADHYIKEDYEQLRVGANFEKVVRNVDLLYSLRKKYYPDSITEIRISGVDYRKNLNRSKFKDFWIKRSDHVTSTFAQGRWNTYLNNRHPKINDACELLWDKMYIWFDGKVNPCDLDYKSYLSYGNVNENTIHNIWKSKIVNKFRSRHLNNQRNKINPCDRCEITFK